MLISIIIIFVVGIIIGVIVTIKSAPDEKHNDIFLDEEDKINYADTEYVDKEQRYSYENTTLSKQKYPYTFITSAGEPDETDYKNMSEKNTYDYYSYYFNNNNSLTKKENFQQTYNNLIKKQISINISSPRGKKLLSDWYGISLDTVDSEIKIEEISNYVVIDIKTTNQKAATGEIIEVSAIKFDNFSPTKCFNTLLKSKKPLSEEFIKISAISSEMLLDKSYFSEIVNDLSEFIGDYNLVGYNLQEILRFLFKNGYNPALKSRKYFDVINLMKKFQRKLNFLNTNLNDLENYELKTLCKYTGIPDLELYRTLDNSLSIGVLFCILVKEIISFKNENFEQEISFENKACSLPKILDDGKFCYNIREFDVVGSIYDHFGNNGQDGIANLNIGDYVILKHDLKNEYSTKAIAVFNNLNEYCGWLPKEEYTLCEDITKGIPVKAIVIDKYIRPYDNTYCIKLNVGLYKKE